jgi:hypothetical protein
LKAQPVVVADATTATRRRASFAMMTSGGMLNLPRAILKLFSDGVGLDFLQRASGIFAEQLLAEPDNCFDVSHLGP